MTKKKDLLTCIQLSKETKAKLDKLGTLSDTYEKVILNLIDSSCVKKGEITEEGDPDE